MTSRSTLMCFLHASLLVSSFLTSSLWMNLRSLAVQKSRLVILKQHQRLSNQCTETQSSISDIRGLKRTWLNVLSGGSGFKNSQLLLSMSFSLYQKKLLKHVHLSGSSEWCDENCTVKRFESLNTLRKFLLIDIKSLLLLHRAYRF